MRPTREDRRLKALGLVLLAAGGSCLAWLSNEVAGAWPTSTSRFVFLAGVCVLAVNLLVVGLLVLAAGCGKTHSASAPQRQRSAVMLRIVLANVLAPAVLLSIFTDDPVLEAEAEREGWYGWLAALALALMLVAWHLWRRSRQYGALGADEAMARDPRPPVLYLRSFADDGEATMNFERSALMRYGSRILALVTPEQEMADVLSRIGPLVAIGKPGEPLPELGAARLYVADADWQRKVIELMDKAGLVVLRLGASPGLLWEVEQALARLPRQRLVFAVLGGSAIAPALASRLAEVLGPSFELALPQAAPAGWLAKIKHEPQRRIGGFVCFDSAGSAHAVAVRRWSSGWRDGLFPLILRAHAGPLRRALHEVFSRLGIGKAADDRHSRLAAVLLAISIGWTGAHWFYLGNKRRGWIYLCTIPLLMAPLFLAWFDALRFLWVDRAEFDSRFSSLRTAPAAA